MNYRVEWSAKAQMAMLEIWAFLDTAKFVQVRRAIAEMERRLADRPSEEGESRTDELRVAFEDSLGVLFTVNEDDRLVSVTTAWLCRQRE